jgi:acylphosphatase
LTANSGAVAIRCLIAGRVQGVYYRSSTATEAQRLKLDGWVKNLPDGRVEVVAAGAAAAVSSLAGWLWRGPPAARVESVLLEEWMESVPSGFAVAK